MMYVPNNSNNNMWTAIGMLGGGMMRDNYDQRGQAKALENAQDLYLYNKNMDTINSLQGAVDAKNDYEVANKAYAGATTDEDKMKYKAQMDAAHTKATDIYGKLNMDGVNSDSEPESIMDKIQVIKNFNEDMKKKYEDKRYKGMIVPGTVPTNPGDIINYYNAKTNKAIYVT